MNRLDMIVALQNSSFKEKVQKAITANVVNEEQAAQMLDDLVFAEQTKGVLGESAFNSLAYDEVKDWLQTLFVAAISIALQDRAEPGLDIEAFFLEAWMESGRTRAWSEWVDLSLQVVEPTVLTDCCHTNVIPVFVQPASDEEARIILRSVLIRHVLMMAERHPDLLVDGSMFAAAV